MYIFFMFMFNSLLNNVKAETDELYCSSLFSSPESKAQGELIGWESSGRPSVRLSVHTFKHEYL